MIRQDEAELDRLKVEFKALTETPSGREIVRLLELLGQQALENSAAMSGDDVYRYQGRWLFVRDVLSLRD